MLAQILHDLYVPRELLDGLSEDQKQLLFCKMREEQVRRYYERKEDTSIITTAGNISKKKKEVTFRLGADGNEWCWIMGESPRNSDEQSYNRANNENVEIDHQHDDKQLRTNSGDVHTLPKRNGVYYTAHRDESKQIEGISNNIQEARHIFERLESDTRRLVLSKENEVLQKQQHSYSPPQISQSDIVDEIFYLEIEERAKKADEERREAARRARDYYRRQSSQSTICFDTNNQTNFALQPITLNSPNRIKPIKKNLSPDSSASSSKSLPVEQESQPSLAIVERQRSKPSIPVTRADIHQWFCTNEIPYNTFCSSDGQIYPWFHGIISRAYAEQLLYSKPVGSYLLRISEKMFGYALSYRASDHCRHLLIEVTEHEHAYRFLGGAKKESFTTLTQLIEKYTNTPIRSNSTDVLRSPCGQIDPEQTDYADLFVETDKQYESSLYISLDTTTSSLQSTTHL